MLCATKKVVLEKKILLLNFLERWVHSFVVLCLKFTRRAVLIG